MKRISFIIILTAVMLVVGGLATASEIKIALDCPPDPEKCGTYVWSKTFADYLTEHGMEVELYPDQALGNEDEKLDQVSQGLLQISNSYQGKVGQIDDRIFGFTLPYLFDSIEHADRVIANTDIMDKINAKTAKEGVRVLAMVAVGTFSGLHNTKKRIVIPDDMKGMRMRAMDKKQAMLFEAWGANSVIIPWAEIYNALQTGVGDGYINPPIVPIMFKHTDVLKYFSDIKSTAPFRTIICSEKWYKGLSDKERALVDEANKQALKANRALMGKWESQSLTGLKEAGVDVYVPKPEEREEFAKKIRPIYGKLIDQETADVFLKAATANR